MSELFIRLYLDEDVNVLISQLLRARGFDVITTREVGQLGKSDWEQLRYALNQGRALLTPKIASRTVAAHLQIAEEVRR